MIKAKYVVLGAALALLVNQTGYAKGGYKKMQYGMAGCGVAALFIDKNKPLPQLAKSLVDGFLGLAYINTSAMTTGSSNCSDSPSADAAKMEQEVFISANFNTLSKEAAQGQGETLAAFAEVLGCDHQELAALSHGNQQRLFSDADPAAVVGKYRTLIHENMGACERI